MVLSRRSASQQVQNVNDGFENNPMRKSARKENTFSDRAPDKRVTRSKHSVDGEFKSPPTKGTTRYKSRQKKLDLNDFSDDKQNTETGNTRRSTKGKKTSDSRLSKSKLEYKDEPKTGQKRRRESGSMDKDILNDLQTELTELERIQKRFETTFPMAKALFSTDSEFQDLERRLNNLQRRFIKTVKPSTSESAPKDANEPDFTKIIVCPSPVDEDCTDPEDYEEDHMYPASLFGRGRNSWDFEPIKATWY